LNKTIIGLIIIVFSSVFSSSSALAAANDPSATNSPQIISHANRLSGNTRFETAKVISEYYNKDEVNNVILATGNEFTDALSASVLAHAKEAPILLVDTSVETSRDAFDYIEEHLDSNGTVYIMGGIGIIGTEFETRLNDLGFKNIIRIAGADSYETSYKIARSLDELKSSTVVISSGEQYPDALTISSFAANKGWPILLTPHDELPQEMIDYLLERKPKNVYITGGEGIISDHVKSEIIGLLPQASVERLMGQSRFDTNVIVAETFVPNPSTIYLATGYGYADAVAGSAVAAKQGDPIIFVDPSIPTLPKSVAAYLRKLFINNIHPNIVSFGGSGIVNDEIIKNAIDLISGTVDETTIYSISNISFEVYQNQSFSLPITVQATLYNSDTLDVPIRWNSTSVDTSKIGSSVFEGVVDSYSKTIKLNLTVKEPLPIAQYSTNFDLSLVNRTENLRLAATALNGKLLAPGERFSFNQSVGERTSEAGYKDALIIEGDTFVPGLGGGICQVSSTLYNAVILAGLEIIERHPHTLPISYVPPGQDATVAYPMLDFKFRNSTDNYLLIRSSVEGNTLTFKLYKKTKN
jgi:putative cell wall-binding protein